MAVEEYGISLNYEYELEEDFKFCQECRTQLEGKEDETYLLSKPEQNIMRGGVIKCDCGQEFYFETIRDCIACIKCEKIHDVKSFPIKEEEVGGTDV